MPKSFALLNRISARFTCVQHPSVPHLNAQDPSTRDLSTEQKSPGLILNLGLTRRLITLPFIVLALQAQAQMIRSDDPALIEKAQAASYGWVAKSDLPEYLHDAIPPGCNGLYIEIGPEAAAALTDEELEKLEVIVEADDAKITDGNKAVLTGNVSVSQGTRSISATTMTYEQELERATLADKVTIREPGTFIQGEYAEVSTSQSKASFNDAKFILKIQRANKSIGSQSIIRGSAKSVKQVSANVVEMEDGRLTACEPGDESWMLEGEKLTVNRETNRGTGKNVKLKVGSVPIFYLPYISFPVGDERQTGFLFPSFRSSDDGGLDFSLPYYWNLAPNYDATLTPRFISGRGTMLEGSARYLNKWMRTEGGLAFLPNDGGSPDPDLDDLIREGQLTEERARPNKGNNRWMAKLDQRGGDTEGWYTRADYTKVSDEDYFRDLGASSFASNNQIFLNQSLEVGYQFDHWKLSSLAQSQQILLVDIDSPYRKLPQIDIDGRYNFDDWTFILQNRYTQFKHRDNRPDILTGQRFNTDYRMRLEKRYPWGFFTPEVGFKTLSYDLDENPLLSLTEQEQLSLSAPQASVDMGLVFEHGGGAFTQTLEPRVFYLYRQFENHDELLGIGANNDLNVNFDTSARTFSYGQLYRDSRFIGGDRLDDANQVTLGLTSRWQNNNTGRDLFIASVGQIFHFRDRRVTLAGSLSPEETEDTSESASELRVNLGRRTQLFTNAIYDTESRKINRGSAGLNFASQDYKKLFNITYSFLRDQNTLGPSNIINRDIDQLDVSFAHPVNKQWSLMGRVNYDFENQQELETFLGFEYNDCCYRLRFLARRWLDSNIANLVSDESAQYDQGIFFEIHFKGLGGSGAKVNSILNDGISGYETREKLLY